MRRVGLSMCVAMALVAPAGTAGAAVPGTIDGSYGRCGVLIPPAQASETVPAGAIGLAGGGQLGVGTADDELVSVRLRADGQIDGSYGTGGVASAKLAAGFRSPIYRFNGVAAQPGGRIVVAGLGTERNGNRGLAVIARLDPDGSLDTSFGSGGAVVDALPEDMGSEWSAIDIDAAGRIVVVGSRGNRIVAARFTPDGAPDPGFGGGAPVELTFPGTTTASVFAVSALPDGSVLAGGQADRQFGLAKLRADGSLDPSFGSGGTTLESPPAASAISTIEPLADGRILVGGSGEDINGNHQVLARFMADGRPDPTFARGGFAVTNGLVTASTIIPQADGSLLVPGWGFAHYSSDGQLDTSFGVFRAFEVGPVVQAPDGSAIGISSRGATLSFVRYALSGPALAALAEQPAICEPRIVTRRVRELLGSASIGLTANFGVLEPTAVTWTARIRAGRLTLRLERVRTNYDLAFSSGLVIELTGRQKALLARARGTVRATLSGRDAAGHRVTAERVLGR